MSGFRRLVKGVSVGIYWMATAVQLFMVVSASFDWISSTALAAIVCLGGFVIFVGVIGFLPSLVFLYWLAFLFLYWFLEGTLHGHFLIAWCVSWATKGMMTLSETRDVSQILERIGGYFFAIFLINLILWLCGWIPGDRAFEIGVVTLTVTIACSVFITIFNLKRRSDPP